MQLVSASLKNFDLLRSVELISDLIALSIQNFGIFTGSKAVHPKDGDRVFLVQENEITRLLWIRKEERGNNGNGKEGGLRVERC